MKRIVLCADGTWNLRDQIDEKSGKRRPTNVTKMARAIRARDAQGVDQVVYYHDGIGTSGGCLDRHSDGAFGHGMEDNVRNLYRFIVYNYQPGDALFLFGFSRGAFTVRTLAGFMHQVGLIEKDDDFWLPEIYACYEQQKGPGTPEWTQAFHKVKGTRPCPPIELIGVWDTVGALGAPGLLGQVFNKNKYRYHDIGLNPAILHAFHALAIDEHRKPFAPDLFVRPQGWAGVLEQAWFPGAHCGVGGSYWPDGLANEALHWIAEKAEGRGLALDATYLSYFKPCFNTKLHDSMSAMYRAMGPHVRPIGRQLADGEVVHQAAIDRRGLLADYRPENLEQYLKSAPAGSAYAQTTRLPRGTPC